VVAPEAGGHGVWSCLLGCGQCRRQVDGCWWSCPLRSHLIVGGGDRSRRVSMAELGGAAGRWLVMVDAGSGWSWSVKRW
jgi:hypothetical protein